jgi:hypothetical protein
VHDKTQSLIADFKLAMATVDVQEEKKKRVKIENDW